MAKAKKKLNTNFLVVAASIATAVAVIGAGGGYMLYRAKRPDQLKAEGRDLMLKREYLDAFNRFSRAGTRKSTDVEFLNWMQETETHLTSFDPQHYWASYGLLGAIASASSDKFEPTLRKLQFDLVNIETSSIDQMSLDHGREIDAAAKLVLEREPNNPLAVRARAFVKILPLFQPGAVTTSAEAQTVVEELKTLRETSPDEPDLIVRYALALIKHREALIREMSISDSVTSEQAKALYAQLRGLSDQLIKVGSDEKKTPDDRARAYLRNYELIQTMLRTRLVPREDIVKESSGDRAAATTDKTPTPGGDEDRLKYYGPRLEDSIVKASTLITPASELYLKTRLKHSEYLSAIAHNPVEAEKVLRETVEKLPKEWRPRLELANNLSEQGKPIEAVEALSVERKPDYDLVGVAGVMFYNDTDAVPLRRAFFRLQSLSLLPKEKQAEEISKVEQDYKAAISRVGESNANALQIQAGLQELQQDRTGAIATLNQALTKLDGVPDGDQLKLRILDQSMRLNLVLGQTGRAAELAERILRAQPGKLANHLQLIDLLIRNGEKKKAGDLINNARTEWPDQPALAALEIRLLPDEASKLKAFEKIPETTRQAVEIKIKYATENGLDKLAGEIAERFLKDNPDDYRVTLMYCQTLLRMNKRDDAQRRITALRAKDPTDTNLIRAEMIASADTPEKMQEVIDAEVANASPLNQKLLEAQQLMSKGDGEGYLRLMREAEKLDPTGAGMVVERIYYYYMASGKLDEAEVELNKLAAMKRDPAEIRTNRLRIALARAQAAEAAGKTDEANKLFEQTMNDANLLASEMPAFSGAWVAKALVLNARGQFIEALTAFRSALDAQPNNTEALHYAIELSAQLGRGDEMKSFIEKGKGFSSGDPYYEEAMLRWQFVFGDPKEVIEPRIKQRDAAPENPNTWLQLGQTYLAASKKATDEAAAGEFRKKAIETFTQAKDKFVESPGFGLYAASAMREGGDVEGSQKLIDTLYADPKNVANTAFLAALSNYYLEQKNNDKALEVMQKLLESGKGNDQQLRGQMAKLYAEAGRVDEAMAIMKDMPDSADTRELRINLLLGTRQVDEAVKLANSYLEKEKNLTNLLLTAFVEGVAGNVARSVDLANQAVAMDQNNAAARLIRAKVMMRERPIRNSDILEDLDVVKKVAPGNIEARVLMSDRLAAMGRVDEAVSELEAVARDLPSNRDATMRLVQAYLNQRPIPYTRIEQIFAKLHKDGAVDPQLLTLETNVALRKGDVAAAVKSAKAAAAADPSNIGLYRQLVDVMIRAGSYKEILTDLDRIQAANQNVYWTYMVRGVVLHRLKRDADAAKEWDRALSITMALKDDSPTGEVVEKYAAEYGSEATGKWLDAKMGQDVRMRALMLGLYASDKQFAKVIELSQSVLPDLPKFGARARIMLLNNIGSAYLSTNPSSPAQAVEIFEKLMAEDPEDVQTLNNLAYALLLEGSTASLDKATKYAQKANEITVKSGSPNAYIADTYGWALIKSGKIQEGIDVLREAQTVEQIPDAAYHLGEAYILEKQKDAAEQSLQNALALVQKLIQNDKPVDPELEGRIRDAIVRANAMQVQ